MFASLQYHRLSQVDGTWRTEIVRDPAVIAAYVRSRQLLEEEATNADTLAPTGDADKDMRARKRYVKEPDQHFFLITTTLSGWRKRLLV
jgi:hypothetical protein